MGNRNSLWARCTLASEEPLRRGNGDRRRETRSALPSALAIELAPAGLSVDTRRGEKEDGEAKGSFNLRPQDQEQGGQRTRGERGRERSTSGQAPAGDLGQGLRRVGRERPLSPGSELQVLSSEAEGAGGADGAKRAWEREASSCFEDESRSNV